MPLLPRAIRRSFAAAFAALACANASSQNFTPALYLPIAASVVRVEAQVDGGRVSLGSGVTVAPSVIATNCHVVRDAVDIRVSGGGGTWSVDGERGDSRLDVCLLRVPGWTGRPVSFAADTKAPQPGATVVALGFTSGAAITPRPGNVRALHAFSGGRVIESDAPFNSGSSGGGLFDENGAMVGLLAFRMRNSVVSYYALPVAWIRESIASDEAWNEVGPMHGAAPFWQGAGEELPAFLRAARSPREE